MVVISESDESSQVVEMEINHFSHREHPLSFISDDQHAETINCFGCDESLDGGSGYYGCKECEYFLHKHCAELDLAPQIKHPFHPKHPLILFPKSPYVGAERPCDFCHKPLSGFVYICRRCGFNLHINCALLQISIVPKFPYSLHKHPLLFLPNHNDQLIKSDCSACEKSLCGPIYYCSVCLSNYAIFNLHKECAVLSLETRKGGGREIHHFSHHHPLLLISYDQVTKTINCSFGDQSLDDDGSRYYGCKGCRYYIHKRCAELDLASQIQHPFHPQHPLTLLPKPSYDSGEYFCDFCDRSSSGFAYHCDVCEYDLHINCALLQSSIAPNLPNLLHFHPLVFFQNHNDQLIKKDCFGCKKPLSGPIYHCSACFSSGTIFNLHKECAELSLETRKVGEMQIIHFSHEHPLFFISDIDQVTETINCFGCGESLDDGSRYYSCNECKKYYLHKKCAELDLAPKIHHPFHPKHLLTLLQKSPYDSSTYTCYLCKLSSSGFVYHCDVCGQINLHIECALLQTSIAPKLPNSLHQHRLFYLPNHNDQLIKKDCSGCMKPLFGPIYHCSSCSFKTYFFTLHKECAELPLEINHPYDLNHPLKLLTNPSSHPEKCSCPLCKIRWKGFVYTCSVCEFDLTLEDVSAPRTITNASHQHPWTLLSRQMSFTCDFCGTDGDRTPYLCVTCDRLVHKNCISLPRKILITRHHHVISHSYPLRQIQLEERLCRICYQEVNTRYGSYHCSHSDCNYIAHPLCATHESIWDGTIIPDDYDDSSMEALLQSSNLITVLSEQMGEGEQMVAIEIKHEFHDHNLRLLSSGEIKDDESQCDGCMRPISTPFYNCDQCKFSLHKDCAELARGKRHPFHKHLLTLCLMDHDFEYCSACWREYNGFSYKCNNEYCDPKFECDIRCILLSDTLEHPSHEHSLFLVHNFPSNCSGCLLGINLSEVAYRCMKRCDFALDMKCATEPLTAQYKYDRHPLTLTYWDDSSPSQHYCDLCEEKREPKDWFYHCTDCDNSLHSKCALADPQFLKLGSKFVLPYKHQHRHPFIVVKNIWNCPPCKVCSKVCNGPALGCNDSECNFTVHWKCRKRIYS